MSRRYNIFAKILNNKFVIHFISICLAVIFFVSALFTSIESVTYDSERYQKFSVENNIKDYAGVSQEKLELMYTSLINYINYGFENTISPYFNEREVHHMRDVRGLYHLPLVKDSYTIAVVAFFLLLLIKKSKFKNRLSKNTRNYILGISIILVIIAIIGVMNFESIFIKFHEIFFNNDLWILDPRTDIMIRMLPQGYFAYLARDIFLIFIFYIVASILFLNSQIDKNKEWLCLNIKVVELPSIYLV